ncbi:MAG TPA: response regulator transcription factor [Actinomycetota bacterium]|nr:response regulator transcription factor [Actinomycetota bacterium]
MSVAEDHPLAREGLVQLLESAEDIVIVGEAADGEEALELADSVGGKPDIFLVDIHLPGIDGLEVTRRLSDAHPDVRVIILTANENPAYATEAVKAGAKAYVLKSAEGEEVLDTVRMVAHGHAVLDRSAFDALAEQGRSRSEQFGLTAREMDVLRLLGKGYRNREIAESLGLSPTTVKTHVARIFKRLEVSDRTDAVVTAFRLGIIE